MKNIAFIVSLFVLCLSCSSSREEELQHIDQILKIYIRNSAGVDLLNTSNPEAFYSVELKDLDAQYDRISVASTKKTDSQEITYLEYVAGATRTLQSETSDAKIYRSRIAVQYRKQAELEAEEDVMTIEYESTERYFRIMSIWYNGEQIFQKQADQPNTITLVKD